MEGFRFAIGDLVCFKHESAVWNATTADERKYGGLSGQRRPHPMMIVERHMQECHGGIQRHYGLRSFANNGLAPMVLITEMEVVAWSEIADQKQA